MFSNYKVIVTGVAGLLGSMLARAFLNDGAFVIGIDKTDAEINGDRYCFIKYNFEVPDESGTLCNTVNEHFGGSLDILINALPVQTEIDLQYVNGQEFNQYIMTSLFPVIDVNRKMYPMLRRTESGNASVVNIGSSISRSNDISTGLECLCSQALIKLTRMQAGSYDGVRCNSVSPICPQDVRTCQDIINTIFFLCSEDAMFITGTDFLIDYGKSAKTDVRLETK